MLIDVSDKVVVVTGSSKGLGKEFIRRLASENAKVVINYLHSENEADELYNEITQYNSNCIKVRADVTKPEDVNFLLEKTCESFGKVDVLINNAGIISDNSFDNMSYEQWNDVIDVNLLGGFLCCKVFSEIMIKQNYGKIINIASLKGMIGSCRQANYVASKAGLIGLTKALAIDLGKHNISVNAVCPGFIVTDLNKNNEEKKMTAIKKSVLPIDNLVNELSDFIVYMISDSFYNISGQVFNLDSRIC